MPLWGNNDLAAQSAIFAPAQLRVAPTAANRDALFGNTTANGYANGITVGQFGVSAAEMAVKTDSSVSGITITNPGTGYTALPTVSLGAPDAADGVQATATLVGKAVTIALNGPGTGGSAVPGEVLTTAGGTGTQATVATAQTEVRVATPTAGSNGAAYAPGDVVTLTDGVGTPATFTVATVTGNAVATITATPTNRGQYTTNPTLAGAVTGNTTGIGTGLKLDVTTRIKTIGSILTAGAWTVLPTLTGNAPTGGGATGVTLNLTIGAGAATMTNTGSGYATPPTPTFGGAGGTATAGTAVLAKGGTSGIAAAGWNLRTVGSGGRAGRVQWETLVSCHLSGDASDDAILPE